MSYKEKNIRELNLEDDFLFAKVMSDTEICRKVLEKILKVPIKSVEIPSTQKTIDILYESRGIRLDVYVNDDKGTVYNVEMQRGKKPELPKRTRYYQGCIDLDLIQSGSYYTELKKTYIIFICTFDPFSDRRHIYTFENRCKENPDIALNDEVTKIFLNTRGSMDDIDSDMKEFLAYVENTTDSFAEQASSLLIKEIQEKVNEIKQSREMEVEYMTLLMRDRENLEQGREEGLEEGLEKGLEKGALLAAKIIRLYMKGKSPNEISDTLSLTLDYVEDTIRNFENV